MKIELDVPDSLVPALSSTELFWLTKFLQWIVNRWCVGALRYGKYASRTRGKYQQRIALEYATYKSTGNFEHLLNIATYCFLESRAPWNRHFHFDPNAASATRDKLGGAIEQTQTTNP